MFKYKEVQVLHVFQVRGLMWFMLLTASDYITTGHGSQQRCAEDEMGGQSPQAKFLMPGQHRQPYLSPQRTDRMWCCNNRTNLNLRWHLVNFMYYFFKWSEFNRKYYKLVFVFPVQFNYIINTQWFWVHFFVGNNLFEIFKILLWANMKI